MYAAAVSLSAENTALLARAQRRAVALVEADPILAQSTPSLELFQHVTSAATSIEIVQRLMEVYAERPAVGVRQLELILDEASGQRRARPLPAFATLSYRQLWQRVRQLAGGLRRRGIGRGDFVVLVGFSTVDHLVAELACHYLAAVSVPLAFDVAAAELSQIAGECQAAAVCCSVEALDRLTRSLGEAPAAARIVVLDVIAGDDEHQARIEGARQALAATRPDLQLAISSELEREGERAGAIEPVIPEAGSELLLSLVYTSGSTGAPKGAMFGERAWHARWSTLPFLELTSLPMVSVVFLPPHHMGGRNAIANSLKLGGLACLTHASDMSTLFDDIRLVRPTYLHLVPRLSELVYQHFRGEVARRRAEVPPSELLRQVSEEMRTSFLGGRMLLALTAAAPTPPDVLAFVKRCFEIPVVNVFAGTEYGQLFVDGSINRHNVLELKLVSAPELGYLVTDEPYARGELLVKTARGISSYFQNEAATRQLRDGDGFLCTGDIFERRGEDELVWIDRKNHVVKLAQGEFINLWRLEALFSSGSPLIQQVSLHGDSQRSYLLAVIVPAASGGSAEAAAGEAAVSDDELYRQLRGELGRLAAVHALAPYQVPRDLLVEREPFSRDNGLLTSLGKPARLEQKRKYGAALERLHQQLEARQAAAVAGLPAPDDTAAADAARAADDVRALSMEARLRRAVAAALGRAEPALELSQSFRQLGGDSIAAANLRMLLQRDCGVRVSAALLGERGSLAEVLAELEAAASPASPASPSSPSSQISVGATTFEQLHGPAAAAIYARDLRLERFFPQATAAAAAAIAAPSSLRAGAGAGSVARNVLLTGATGFLGRFLCLALLERAARLGGEVVCLVRARSEVEALHRLTDSYGAGSPLQQRFLALSASALHVVAGELEAPHFGLSEDLYPWLAARIDTALHAAAAVNHALPYAQLFEPNVLGTAEVMRFCLNGRPKRFNFVSTSSLALALLGDRQSARERDDVVALGDGWSLGEPRHAGGYQASKWAGEVLARELAERYGVDVNVLRCNLILPPAGSRGQINANDFLTRLVQSVVDTGLVPVSFYEPPGDGGATPHLDGFPVDFLAEAITAIATAAPPPRSTAAGSYAVYHLNNVQWRDGVSLDSLMRRLVARGHALAFVDDHDAWFAAFARALRRLDGARAAASSLPILEQWRRPLEVARRQRIDASAFLAQVAALRPHGLAEPPALDDAYFDRFLDDLQALGIISATGP